MNAILNESLPFGLALFGASWNKSPIWRPYWRGVLPFEYQNVLYKSARVILNLTKQSQNIAGMINNRIYDSLACGACVISDYFPELEANFGSAIRYVKKPGDTTAHLTELLNSDSALRECQSFARKAILAQDTWHVRSEELLRIYETVLSHRIATPLKFRRELALLPS